MSKKTGALHRSNLKCKLTWALKLGYQCSEKQMIFLRNWFKNNPETSSLILKNSVTEPCGSTVQSPIDSITLYDFKTYVLVDFKHAGINMRADMYNEYQSIGIFKINKNSLLLFSETLISEKKGKFWDNTPR